jgi:hypothetical protein
MSGRNICQSSLLSAMMLLSLVLMLSTTLYSFVDALSISRHYHQRTHKYPGRSSRKSSPLKSSNQQQKKSVSVLSAATGLSLDDLENQRTKQQQQPQPSVKENDKFKVGVLFLNLGGPTTGEDVEG